MRFCVLETAELEMNKWADRERVKGKGMCRVEDFFFFLFFPFLHSSSLSSWGGRPQKVV